MAVVQHLYAQIAPGELFRLLQRNLGRRTHDGIYTPRLVLWMMMMQRLDARGTLASSVERLAQGQLDPLLSRCKRVREKNIALATGGYCQARQNLPKVLMERSVEEILQRLFSRVSEAGPGMQPPIYLLDGSSLQLDHHTELKKAYPPAPSRHGESHWPIVRIVALQEAETGLAQRPCWGPMYGPHAVSEQALAEKAIDREPAGAVIIGDRNFGTFSMAYAMHLRGHSPLIRLTKVRAHKIMGGPISREGDYPVEWTASRWDRANHAELPENASIPGRLIARRIGRGKNREWLYLFTTLTIAAEEGVAWYGKRWNVETDLRSLKRTVRLQHLSVQSVDMMEKELFAAVLAYNLVRTIMCLAAQTAGVRSRQLSFTYAYNIVHDGIGHVLAATSIREQMQRLERIVRLVSRCKLPNRKKRRSFPREVWGQGQTFPSRRSKTK